MEQLVYVDNAATTPLSQSVLEAMTPYLTAHFGNPSSLHKAGQTTRKAVEDAREQVATLLGADRADEITFTSGGTEADNLAVLGVMARSKKKHLITSVIEHPALLDTCKYLEKQGCTVTYLPVDKHGMISLDDLKSAMTEETALVSIMMANNEIGTIEPIAEIGAICREKKVLFHTDAVQGVGHIPVNVKDLNVDLLSFSSHKINGPKGAGVLYVRKGVLISPILHGGGQERNRRSGTENVANIVATAKALSDAVTHMDTHMSHAKALRDRLVEGIMKIPYTHYTGHPEQRLSGTASFVFEAIEGEGLLLLLDMNGICCSTGSACATGSLEPSHVLMAIGLPHEIAHGSLRVTFGYQNTQEEVDYIIEKVTQAVERLRAMSPVWETMMKNENK